MSPFSKDLREIPGLVCQEWLMQTDLAQTSGSLWQGGGVAVEGVCSICAAGSGRGF